ncbi:MAG: hypothetical protein M3P82_00685, partial [Bacteroidota bacterium]|nr:hypothetical protein [Bacteroidota bacterium]
MAQICKIILLIGICSTLVEAQSVTWQKYYPYNQSNAITDIIQTFDGGYIMAGGISFPPAVKILLIKINYLGIKEWEKVISDSAYNISAVSIKQASDSGYVMTGQRNDDFYILKTDSKGNYQWRKSFNINNGDARAFDIITSADGYILSGGIYYSSSNSSKSYVVKTDSSGNLQWQKLYGDSILTSAGRIIQILKAEYFLSNITRRNLSDPYLGMIYKLNSKGGIIWKKETGINQGGIPVLYRENEGLFLAG